MLGLLMATVSFAGPIKITLYGKGGIIHTDTKDKICPDPSDCVCTEMTIFAKDLADYEGGLIDALPATLMIGKTPAKVLVHSMDQIEVDNRTVVLYESPELTAFKEWGVGKASGVTVSFTEPVQLMGYAEAEAESDAETGYIKIEMKGSGGIHRGEKGTVICPLKSQKLCAIVEGTWWDVAWQWIAGNKPVGTVGNVGITTYSDGVPEYSFKGVVKGVTEGSVIQKGETGYQIDGSAFHFSLVE